MIGKFTPDAPEDTCRTLRAPDRDRTHNHAVTGTRRGGAYLLLALVLICLIPTNQSLWIDEGFSLSYADEPNAKALAHRILTSPGSEPLMPLGMFSIWAGSKLFGRSELGLRSSSVIWAAIAVFIMWRLGSTIGAPWLAVVFASHPFLWYYASEARPYTMTMALSAGVLYCAVSIITRSKGSRSGVLCFLLLGILLCGTHALASIPFLISGTVVGVVLAHRRWKPHSKEIFAALIPVAILSILAAYYFEAFLKDEGRTWRIQWAFSFESAAFSAYELLGMSGLGPGRNVLRELAVSGGLGAVLEGLKRAEFFAIIALTCIYGWMVMHLIRKLQRRDRFTRETVALPLVVIVGTFAIAVLSSFILTNPFWGRHLAALAPFVTFAAGLAFQDTRSLKSTFSPLLWFFVALLLTSSLVVRFGASHARDDYRDAARLASAEAEAGRTVWWCADPGCAEYYGLKFCREYGGDNVNPCIVYVSNQPSDYILGLRTPDLVVVSKPDLHDRDDLVGHYLGTRRYRVTRELSAFKIYGKSPS